MKVGFISDCHLGYKTGKKTTETRVNLREQDGLDAFEESILDMIDKKVDLVIIGGDLFDSPNPSINTVVSTQKIFEKLTDNKIPCYIITGNHDTSDIKYDHSASVLVNNKAGGIYSFEEPIVVREMENVRFYFISHQSNEEQAKTFDSLDIDNDYINIMVTHGSCFDNYMGEIIKNDQEPREIVIPEKIIELNWDYILMGHIHTRGWVHSSDGKTDTANKKQFYGGSLIRRGFADKESPLGRGWTLLNIKDKENIELKTYEVKQREQYDLFIKCKDKDIAEINSELNKTIKNLKKSDYPIVRVTFLNLDINDRPLIDFASLKEITDSFLTFITKFDLEERLVDGGDVEYNYERKDLLSDYKKFWESQSEGIKEDIRKETKEKTEEYIKIGINNTVGEEE